MVDTDDLTTVYDLRKRSHSWRNYGPDEFVEAAIADGKVEARTELSAVESGRFEPMLEAGSKFFRALDPDERREFANRNPDMMRWLGAWNMLQDLNPWNEYHDRDYPGLERFHDLRRK